MAKLITFWADSFFFNLLEWCRAVKILVSSRFFEQMNFEQLTHLQYFLKIYEKLNFIIQLISLQIPPPELGLYFLKIYVNPLKFYVDVFSIDNPSRVGSIFFEDLRQTWSRTVQRTRYPRPRGNLPHSRPTG